jgi:hypothetical protein
VYVCHMSFMCMSEHRCVCLLAAAAAAAAVTSYRLHMGWSLALKHAVSAEHECRRFWLMSVFLCCRWVLQCAPVRCADCVRVMHHIEAASARVCWPRSCAVAAASPPQLLQALVKRWSNVVPSELGGGYVHWCYKDAVPVFWAV